MLKRKIEIELDDARVGMTLAEPVLDGKGIAMLPVGTILNESIFTSLRRRGIDTVTVINDAISEADLRFERDLIKKRLAVLFRKAAPGGAVDALRATVVDYRIGNFP